MAHAHCMLGTKGYNHTLRIYNTYCFPTATIVAGKRLSITLYINGVSCWNVRKKLRQEYINSNDITDSYNAGTIQDTAVFLFFHRLMYIINPFCILAAVGNRIFLNAYVD
jgi:hypothetical protein